MRLVAGWAREAGLEPALDDFGNLWALGGWDSDSTAGRAGADSAPIVTSGSHVDTVPDGGRYDGALGTVLGLEVAAELGAGGGLLICAAEEAPRFGAGTMGSRQMVGTLSQEALAHLHDSAGVSAAEARAAYLQELDDLPRITPPLHRLRAHAEVHVAQRRAVRELGVVTTVASPRRLEITVSGLSGHAGEVSMADRRDALAGAAEVVLAIERAATEAPAETVATVGTLTVTPGAISVIPGQARIGVDMRGVDGSSLDRLQRATEQAAAEIGRRRGVQVQTVLTRAGEPVELDPGMVSAGLAAADALEIPARTTWSGAGHDAQHLSSLTPALLVFVPLHGGESHTPQEGADLNEIVHAAMLVAYVMRHLGA